MSGGNSGVGNNNIITTSIVCDNGVTNAIQYLTVDGFSGDPISVHYTDENGAAYTPVGPITLGACVIAASTQTVSYDACDGGNNEIEVDSTVGAYLLNQDYTHYKVLYDNITREISGDVALSVGGTELEINATAVTGTNVSIQRFYIDYGTGYTDIFNGGSSFYNTPSVLPGKYEAKLFARYDDNGRQVNKLLAAIEWTKPDGGNPFFNTVGPVATSRTWTATDGAFIRGFCGDDVSGIHGDFHIDGTPYVAAGTPSLTEIYIHDELIDHADSADLGSAVVTLSASSKDIADGIWAADLGSDGTSFIPAGNITSITIHAKKSDVDYSTVNAARNQVVLGTYGGGPTVLEEGQTVTFSAEDGNNISLSSVTCVNDAAAQIFYTVRP